MKRVSVALMAFAALLMVSCHDEPVTTSPIDADSVMQELPNSEWWECIERYGGPTQNDGGSMLLNISWDYGVYYAHSDMNPNHETIILNDTVPFHILNDTIYCDYWPEHPDNIKWVISFPNDTAMRMESVLISAPGIPMYNIHIFRRVNISEVCIFALE